MIVILIFLGFANSAKTAIHPQIIPFIVKEEIKIESGNAYS